MARFGRDPSSREPSIWDSYQGEYPALTAWGAPTYQYWWPYPFTDPSRPTGATAGERAVSPSEKLGDPLAAARPVPNVAGAAPFLPGGSTPLAQVAPAIDGALPGEFEGGDSGPGAPVGPLGSSLSESDPSSALDVAGVMGGQAANVVNRGVGIANPMAGLLMEAVRGIGASEARQGAVSQMLASIPASFLEDTSGKSAYGKYMTTGEEVDPAYADLVEEGLPVAPQGQVMPGWGQFSLPGNPAGPYNAPGYAPGIQNTTNFGRTGGFETNPEGVPSGTPASTPAPGPEPETTDTGFTFGDTGGGPGGGEGTVICTALHARGFLTDAILAANHTYAKRMGRDAHRGYLRWATPIVRFSTKSPKRFNVVWALTKPLIHAYMRQIAYETGVAPKGSWVGKTLLTLGVPLSRVVGRWGARRRAPHASPA